MPKKPSKEEYMTAVGQLVQNGSFADVILFSTFQQVSGCDAEVAKAIYQAVKPIYTRSKILQRVADIECDNGQQNVIEEIIDSAKTINTQRNELAHSLLVDFPDEKMTRISTKGHPRPVTRAYLDSLIKQSDDALTDCRVAYFRLCQMRGKPQKLLY